MPNYWFILGRETKIAAAEIGAVLGLKKHNLQPPILKVCMVSLLGSRGDEEVRSKYARSLIKRLGGTIKIAEEMTDGIGEEKMLDALTSELENIDGKIIFGISFYGQDRDTKIWGLQIKKRLKEKGRSVRFVYNDETVLSSVTVEKNGLTARGKEFLIVKNNSKFSIATTLAVQPFEEFSARDFGRPGRDDLSGMLPPKLAMMMINLSQADKEAALLDPFCGSGTILTEAMLMGYTNLIGTDISEKAVEDTKQNVEWTKEKFINIEILKYYNIKIFESGADSLIKKISPASINAIVTEPFLGKPLRGNESEEELNKQISELKKLYLETFEQFKKILKPGGTVVIIIPRFKYSAYKYPAPRPSPKRGGEDARFPYSKQNRAHKVSFPPPFRGGTEEVVSTGNTGQWLRIDIASELKNSGFAAVPLFENEKSLLYARPNQRVGREIWKFIRQ